MTQISLDSNDVFLTKSFVPLVNWNFVWIWHNPQGYIFPILVTSLVPIRSFLISRFFSEADLVYLDPIGETEQEAHDEKVTYLERRASVAISYPGFSSFHASGYRHDMEEAKKLRDALENEDILSEDVELSAGSSLTKRHQASTTTERA